MLKPKRKSLAFSGILVERALGYVSLGLLAFVGLALLLPSVSNGADALGEDVILTAGLTTKTTAYLYSTISLSTSGQVDIDIVPKSTGALSIGAADVQVATNNTTGYSIFLSTVDQTNRLNQIDSDLQYSGSEQQNYIAALGTTTTAGDYLATSSNLNTWGYALTTGEANSKTEYRGIGDKNGEQVYTTTGTTSKDNYKLNVAVAVDTSLPAGGYRNGLVVTAVANPIILSGFNQIYYMQDMTPAICESAEMESTAQLVDKRDNQLYWVAKLKDGNCWMAQNLALDLSTDVTLTPEDSDVTKEWVPNRNTEKTIPVAATADYNAERSWNLGNVALTNPTGSSACKIIATGEEITDCPWYKNVTGLASGYNATEISSINSGENSYDAHYLIGNYYSWEAATAGSGVATNEANTNNTGANSNPEKLIDATDSICPNGWKMPTAGQNINLTAGWPFDREDSFYKLLKAYDYPSTGDSSTGNNPVPGWESNNGKGKTAISGDSRTRLDFYPMYFTRSGYINPISGTLRGAGSNGYYWSSTAYPNANTAASYLSFDLDLVYPSYNDHLRYAGFSVRCLAH